MIGGNGSDVIVLKLVEVGFVKGIFGIDIVIEVLDVIFMDDSFLLMVKCIFWSCVVKDSYVKVF